MTEEQIIEYLEHCSTTESCHKDKCPCLKEGHTCIAFESKPVLELINRQKAEIENHNVEVNKMVAEIERLREECRSFADIGKMYSEIKAEAIKEFAERLKKKMVFETSCLLGIPYYRITAEGLNGFVKEMVGDNNG